MSQEDLQEKRRRLHVVNQEASAEASTANKPDDLKAAQDQQNAKRFPLARKVFSQSENENPRKSHRRSSRVKNLI